MLLPLLIAVQVSAGQLPPAGPVPPPDFETANVLAPIQQLFTALERGDSAAMLRLVHPDGRVTATGQRATGSGLRSESWIQFSQRINPASRFSETIGNPAVEVDGDVAMVWAPFVVRIDGKVANCGHDLFDLVRDKGAWKIMNLTFSSRTTDCPTQ